jgi:hypothetical protein
MRSNDLVIEPPYNEALTGVLAFATFEEAESTIRTLENLCRKYRDASDKKGVEYCRRIASLGRYRAGLIGRNPKVMLQKRLRKQEIAEWFRIWLETPSVFEDWLAMRKSTEEFRKLSESTF